MTAVVVAAAVTAAAASADLIPSLLILVDAKGVAGLGKAGGDGQGGSDKAGQQVPPEVYNALTYAGSAFLLTLSAPVILYSLNKLLNKIEDCFGCGPSSKKKTINEKQQSLNNQQNDHHQKYKQQQLQRQSKPLCQLSVSNIDGNMSLLSQHQSIGPSTDSTAITLPSDYNLNYNASPQQQNIQQQQHQHRPQPYIISTPHL